MTRWLMTRTFLKRNRNSVVRFNSTANNANNANNNCELSQEERVQRLNPPGFEFLNKTEVKKSAGKYHFVDVTLWDHLQTYAKQTYAEKSLLIDESLAEDIAGVIGKSSNRGAKTRLLDADGGFSYVTKFLLEKGVFEKATIFQKDSMLERLHVHALQTHLKELAPRIADSKINLNQIASKIQTLKGEYISPLTTICPTADWLDEEPPYTLYGTVTHGLIKYIVQRCLQRKSFFSEFSRGRPEFFFVVSGRTWNHLNTNKKNRVTYLHHNILFQILFDYETVMELPRASFVPWKKLASNAKTGKRKIYAESDDYFYLMKIRPKKDIGLSEKAKPEYLDFFVFNVYRNKVNRLIPMLEQWVPGSGLDFVKKGHKLHERASDLPLSRTVECLNLLAEREDFANSGFVSQCEIYQKSKFSGSNGDDIVQEKVEMFRQKFGVEKMRNNWNRQIEDNFHN